VRHGITRSVGRARQGHTAAVYYRRARSVGGGSRAAPALFLVDVKPDPRGPTRGGGGSGLQAAGSDRWRGRGRDGGRRPDGSGDRRQRGRCYAVVRGGLDRRDSSRVNAASGF